MVWPLASPSVPSYLCFSPFSFVWLVYLIWSLSDEGCCALCVWRGHWHLSSPRWGQPWNSVSHWPSAPTATSSGTAPSGRRVDLSLRGLKMKSSSLGVGLSAAINSAGTKCGSPAWKTSQTGICTLVYMAMGLCVCFPQEAVRLRTSPPKKPHLCPSPLPTAAWLLSVANVQSHLLSTAKIIKTQQSPVAGSCKTVSKTLHQTSLYLQ